MKASECFEKFKGQKIVMQCARYVYWGRLSEVGDDYIILADAVAVEETGPCSGPEPRTVDPIGGSIVVSLDAYEIMMQPEWSKSPLPSEK